MSQDWYLITPPLLSGNESDYINDFGIDTFTELLDTFIGEDIIIYNSSMCDFNITKAIVSDKTSNVFLSKHTLSLLLPLNSCNSGMYIRYKDSLWLITGYVNDNGIYQKTIVELCTYTLKFQHPQTGAILSYPCIISNRIQGTGDKETDTMTLPDGRKIVLLPFDKNTILLQNSHDKTWRFFLDNHPTTPRVYELNFADTTSRPGLIELYCSETQSYHVTDRVDLGICDYFESIPIAPPPTGNKYITISTSGKLVIGGSQRTFTATLFDNDVEQSFNPTWVINYNSMPEKCFIVTYEDNKCMIKVKDDYEIYNYIGKYITIICCNEDQSITTKYDVTITAGY